MFEFNLNYLSHAGVNIFRIRQGKLGKSFPIFWVLGKILMKFNSRRVVTILDWEVITTWRETFLNVMMNSTQSKGIVSHDEVELNTNYPKMSQFTHKFREKIAINLSRFTHNIGEKIAIDL